MIGEALEKIMDFRALGLNIGQAIVGSAGMGLADAIAEVIGRFGLGEPWSKVIVAYILRNWANKWIGERPACMISTFILADAIDDIVNVRQQVRALLEQITAMIPIPR